jgi:hypothetical protein
VDEVQIWQSNHSRMRINFNEKPTFRPGETVSVSTSAFHRTNVGFGKHWSLSALASRQQLSQGSLSRKCSYSAKRWEARSI